VTQQPAPAPSLKTIFYVDGFNFYYRALKDSPYKWLDVSKLFQTILPRNTIHKIRYFTSPVSGTADDPLKPVRQELYFRALRTIPNIEIKKGEFHTNEVRRAISRPLRGLPRGTMVDVVDTKEKGADVMLATMLTRDACHGEFEAAVVLTNDSDQLLPIQTVRDHFGYPIGVLDPSSERSTSLPKAATFYRQIRQSHLKVSLFPNSITDAKGTFTKPPAW
jgi:hypothetical protein